MGLENDQLVIWVAQIKANVNIDTSNEGGSREMDFYFHVYVLAMELATHIQIRFKEKKYIKGF